MSFGPQQPLPAGVAPSHQPQQLMMPQSNSPMPYTAMYQPQPQASAAAGGGPGSQSGSPQGAPAPAISAAVAGGQQQQPFVRVASSPAHPTTGMASTTSPGGPAPMMFMLTPVPTPNATPMAAVMQAGLPSNMPPVRVGAAPTAPPAVFSVHRGAADSPVWDPFTRGAVGGPGMAVPPQMPAAGTPLHFSSSAIGAAMAAAAPTPPSTHPHHPGKPRSSSPTPVQQQQPQQPLRHSGSPGRGTPAAKAGGGPSAAAASPESASSPPRAAATLRPPAADDDDDNDIVLNDEAEARVAAVAAALAGSSGGDMNLDETLNDMTLRTATATITSLDDFLSGVGPHVPEDPAARRLVEDLRKEVTDKVIRAKIMRLSRESCEGIVTILENDAQLMITQCTKERASIVAPLVEKLGPDTTFTLLRFLLDHFAKIALSMGGCIALPRIFPLLKPSQADVFVEAAMGCFDELIGHEYGNFVLKHIATKQQFCTTIIHDRLSMHPLDNLVRWASTKGGSHVIETTIENASATDLAVLCRAMLASPTQVRALAHCKFGNYCVQSAFKAMTNRIDDVALHTLCAQTTSKAARDSPFAQNIMKRVAQGYRKYKRGGSAAADGGGGSSPTPPFDLDTPAASPSPPRDGATSVSATPIAAGGSASPTPSPAGSPGTAARGDQHHRGGASRQRPSRGGKGGRGGYQQQPHPNPAAAGGGGGRGGGRGGGGQTGASDNAWFNPRASTR